MIVSAHQPAYLPWLGYLDKIARADVFVYLDAVQFEKNSFTNRNRIKTPQGPLWLTIPVKMRGHLDASLADLAIDDAQPWREKHLKSIAANYRRAPHFEPQWPRLEAVLRRPEARLAEFCWHELQFWLAEFGITTRIVRQSALPPTGRKSELVLDLCRTLGATRYLSGAMGRDYLDTAAFAEHGIAVEFQQFAHPVYPQLWGDFLPAMGVVDAWMNAGPVRPPSPLVAPVTEAAAEPSHG